MVYKKSMNKSMIVLCGMILIMATMGVSALFTSEDIDEVCDLDNHTLYRYNGTWVCGDLSDTTINYTINNITNIINNKTDFWDDIDTPADISAGDINDDGTYIKNNTDAGYVYRGNFQANNGAGAQEWYVEEHDSDIHFHFPDLGGANYVGWSTTGAFMELYANPNPSNGYKMWAVTETQGADTEINIYEGGTGHNRFWDSGSMRIGGSENYLCSELTTDVDCDTPATGADLIVQDDGWFGGKVFSSDWSNVSISESQISDLSHTSANNDSWNESYADSLYRGFSNYTFDGDVSVAGGFNASSPSAGVFNFIRESVNGIFLTLYNDEGFGQIIYDDNEFRWRPEGVLKMDLDSDGNLTIEGDFTSNGMSYFRGVKPPTSFVNDAWIVFNATDNITDVTGEYDSSTGIFTARSDGVYLFTSHIRFDSTEASQLYYTAWWIDGGHKPGRSAGTSSLLPGGRQVVTSSASIKLDAGEEVTLVVRNGGTIAQDVRGDMSVTKLH